MLALLIGTLALASLRARFDALPVDLAILPLTDTLWMLAASFAVLSNLGVAGLMFAVARGWHMPARVAAAACLAMGILAFVYHSRIVGGEGGPWWADQGLHTGVPLAVGLWWWRFAERPGGWGDLPWLLVWPTIYGLYALVRGNLATPLPGALLGGDLYDLVQLGAGMVSYLLAFVLWV